VGGRGGRGIRMHAFAVRRAYVSTCVHVCVRACVRV
jgi:hypothetical protein